MKKIIKRVSAAVVALAVMLTAVLLDVPEKVTAAEIVQSGTCGDNITWTLDADGVLTISGTGAMPNYGIVSKPPWNDLKDQIKSVVIENGVTSIGSYAFYQCASLTSADLPDSVKVLGNWAFRECSMLRKMIIPNSVTSITGTCTFYGCEQLAEVTLSNNLTALPESMFNRCSALKSITIPDSVTEIGQDVFLRCTSLTSLTIPSSVQTIGEEIVGWCSGLKTVVIENGLTSLALKAFFECSGLTSVTLPESLTKIDGGAFNRCKSLKSITIPENVTSIGNNAFTNCTSLENITIPDSVTSIGKEVFKGCTLNEVRFGGKTPPTLPAKSDLCTATSTEKITVPCTAVDQYKTADGFSNLADKISGKHTLTKTEAKSPTCTEDGNKEYWHCSECGKYFSDSACTNVITDTVIAQTGHYYNATWSSDDTNHWHECSRCDDKIDIANHTFVQKSDDTNHWQECSVCAYKKGETAHSWSDWTLTTEPTLNTMGTAERACDCNEKQTKTDIPKLTDPIWTRGDRTDPTLNDTGSEKYTSTDYGTVTITIPELNNTTVWTKDNDKCVPATESSDGKDVYKSEYGEVTITLDKLPHTHTLTHIPKVPATETTAGTKEHWHCKGCSKDFADENGTTEITDLTIPVIGHTHTLTHIPKVPATETTAGTKEHWHCEGCSKDFADANGTTEITDLTIPVIGHTHTLTHIPKVPATETTAGTKEHWHCEGCSKNFADANGTTEITDLTIPVIGHTHTLTHIPKVPATETTAGTKEHWHCEGCSKDFADENGTQEVTADDLKIGKVETEVQAPVNVPKPEIATPKEELIAAALTEDEQREVEKGTDIKIILKVENATENVPAEDKGKVETEINRLSDYKFGQYLDVTLLKKIGDQEQKITTTKAPIKITFEIPESLRGKAEYSVIRVHNGTATVLRDLDSAPDTVTIETDKFSTYALTYKEKTTTPDPGDDTSEENPDADSDSSSTAPTESDSSGTTSDGDNGSAGSSDTTPNGSDTNSIGSTSSNDESDHVPSESSPSEDNGNPSTGIAVSSVPLTAALAAVVIIVKRRRK